MIGILFLARVWHPRHLLLFLAQWHIEMEHVEITVGDKSYTMQITSKGDVYLSGVAQEAILVDARQVEAFVQKWQKSIASP